MTSLLTLRNRASNDIAAHYYLFTRLPRRLFLICASATEWATFGASGLGTVTYGAAKLTTVVACTVVFGSVGEPRLLEDDNLVCRDGVPVVSSCGTDTPAPHAAASQPVLTLSITPYTLPVADCAGGSLTDGGLTAALAMLVLALLSSLALSALCSLKAINVTRTLTQQPPWLPTLPLDPAVWAAGAPAILLGIIGAAIPGARMSACVASYVGGAGTRVEQGAGAAPGLAAMAIVNCIIALGIVALLLKHPFAKAV